MVDEKRYARGQALVQEGLALMADDGEIVTTWVATADVVGPEGIRYLAHRAGGGHDGTEGPMAWVALGMLRASAALAEDQVLDQSRCTCDDDEDDEDDD
jgi:hypothetical protein